MAQYFYPSKTSRLLVALLSAVFLTQDLPAQELGGVRGIVIDADGEPVRDVSVELRPTNTVRSRPRIVLTDGEGRFEALDLVPRRYEVIAFKNEDGYAYPRWSIYAADRPPIPEVDVVANRVADIVVNLGLRGAKLVGDVVDSETGRPITTSRYKLVRLDDRGAWLSSGPDENGHIVIPIPSAGVELEVTAPAYEPWNSGPILVPRGETKQVTIPLRRQR